MTTARLAPSDEPAIHARLAAGDNVVIQLTADGVRPEHLAGVDSLCARYDGRLGVRFYGTVFDARTLDAIPSVKSLTIQVETLHQADALAGLCALESLDLLVRDEIDRPNVLDLPSLRLLSRLAVTQPKRSIDLAPLVKMERLVDLSLVHAKDVGIIGDVPTLARLSFTGIHRAVRLSALNRLPALRSLRVGFGSRETLDEICHEALESLEIEWVRGLESIEPSRFPSLKRLNIDTQSRIVALDLRANPPLEHLMIRECKKLTSILGLGQCVNLRDLHLAWTALDLETMVASDLPPHLESARLFSGKRKIDTKLHVRLSELGIRSIAP